MMEIEIIGRAMRNEQVIRMPTSQSGAVLFTALVLMVLMTLLAVTMMGNTALDEKMAQNSQDKNRAFQGAETGIEMAIADAGTLNTSNTFNAAGVNTFSQGDINTLGTAQTGYGVNVTYSSVFLQKTAVSRGSGFDTSFANYWFELQSLARTDTGASSTVSLGIFQVGAD
jgi:Tfp pilus assembly protein PilX